MTAGHIVLVGPMGVGKTTVGTEVARRLGRPLRDSDADLGTSRGNAPTGPNARELAEQGGVAALHRREADLLLDALAAPTPSVITAAASVVEDPRAVEALQAPFVVWLTAPPEVLVPRLGSGDHRRGLGPDPVAAVARLAARRKAGYEAVADTRLEVAGRRPDELARTVVDLASGDAGDPRRHDA